MRSLDEIHRERQGRETLGHLVAALHAKLELISQLALFEYAAAEEGLDGCSEGFRELAAAEHEAVLALLRLVPEAANAYECQRAP